MITLQCLLLAMLTDATPNEEQQTIATAGATDADAGTTIAYSISGGQDACSGLFTVDTGTGALTFTNAPDFENPGCGVGTDSNACTVILTATDGTNDDTITVTVNIMIQMTTLHLLRWRY